MPPLLRTGRLVVHAEYFALGKQLLQYLWTIIAPSNLNNASVVAVAAHDTQNPGVFFVPSVVGRVSYGFSVAIIERPSLKVSFFQPQSS
jgi:hypothetical protein